MQDREWLIMISISWNMPDGRPAQGGRVWLQAFDLRETEGDVYQWTVDKLRNDMPQMGQSAFTVLYYRAVPNLPVGHPEYVVPKDGS